MQAKERAVAIADALRASHAATGADVIQLRRGSARQEIQARTTGRRPRSGEAYEVRSPVIDVARLVSEVESALRQLEKIRVWVPAPQRSTITRLHEVMAAKLREHARQMPGVTAVYLTTDGTDFVITGPTWTEHLSETTARLAVDLQAELAPDGKPYIQGVYVEGEERPGIEWVKVFP